MSSKVKANSGLHRLTLGTASCVREVYLQQSITKASLRLGISQSAVSQHVSKFEKVTGTRIVFRDKNESYMNMAIKEFVFSLARAQDEFVRSVDQQNMHALRLGMCECLSTALSTQCLLDPLLEKFKIYIAKPSALSELYERSEIDMFVRPLSLTEREVELYTGVSIDWIASVDWEPRTKSGNSELNIMVATQMSPYNDYTEAQLSKSDHEYKVVARIDDPLQRVKTALSAHALTFIPGFLRDTYGDQVKSIDIFGKAPTVRYGLIYNKKRLCYKTALSFFDDIERVLSPLD